MAQRKNKESYRRIYLNKNAKNSLIFTFKKESKKMMPLMVRTMKRRKQTKRLRVRLDL
jgi:hypothetical protein